MPIREVKFINQYKSRWQEFEEGLKKTRHPNPNYLARLYISLLDDLSYAKTYYPESSTVRYLNQLSKKAHELVYFKKQYRLNLLKFYKEGLPFLIYQNRRLMVYSFLLMALAALFGVFSLVRSEEFVYTILGNQYMNQTIENIEKGNPMGIYESRDSFSMFLMIAWNNIRVSFFAYALGISFGVGTALLLIRNGIMLGTFYYYFIQRGLGYEASSAIWMHGTLEIFSIVIAGGAGMMLGAGWLYPKSYSRLQALRKNAWQGMQIITGMIPIFLVAAFIEGYFTRYYQQSPLLSNVIIIVSIIIILVYFIYWPYQIAKKHDRTTTHLVT